MVSRAGLLTVDRRHGGHCGLQQGAGVGQEGLAGEGPLDLVVEAVTIQQGFDLLADLTIGELGAETKLNWTCSSPMTLEAPVPPWMFAIWGDWWGGK